MLVHLIFSNIILNMSLYDYLWLEPIPLSKSIDIAGKAIANADPTKYPLIFSD